MANSSEIDLTDNPGARDQQVDWADMIRLAVIVSLFAAAAAMALAGHVSETTIVISVIVVATMASWFHIEHAGRQPRPAHVRQHHRCQNYRSQDYRCQNYRCQNYR